MITVRRPRLLALALAMMVTAVVLIGGGPPLVSDPAPTPTATPQSSNLTDQEGRILAERLYETTPDRIERKRARYDRAREIQDPTGFINAENVSLADYVGEKVVLIEFWTFGCRYCERTNPHIEGFWREYEDDGLVVVGVHYPEFSYEEDPENVREYVAEEGLTYPVVLDNEGGTWSAYDMRAWPTRVLIGVDGFVRYERRGSGGYNETERRIRKLLAERDRVVNGS